LFYVDGGIFHHPYVVGLRHAWLLKQCITKASATG
jgi:hypothetical protein